MSEPGKILGDALRAELKEVVREVLHEEGLASANGHSLEMTEGDTLLTAEEAAKLMGVTPRWLRRHWKRLPFARKISRKVLRFSTSGLHRWAAAKKPDSRR